MSWPRFLAVLGLLAPTLAAAQPVPVISTPLPPAAQQPGQVVPMPPGGLPQAPGFPNVWLPKEGATLQALDKVNARASIVPLKANEPGQFQTLTIELKACVVRPPDQPADAAAFVTVTDSRGQGIAFSGWLIRSSPATSMVQHPIYDLRVIACG